MTGSTFYPKPQEIRNEYEIVGATSAGLTYNVYQDGHLAGQTFFPADLIDEQHYELEAARKAGK